MTLNRSYDTIISTSLHTIHKLHVWFPDSGEYTISYTMHWHSHNGYIFSCLLGKYSNGTSTSDISLSSWMQCNASVHLRQDIQKITIGWFSCCWINRCIFQSVHKRDAVFCDLVIRSGLYLFISCRLPWHQSGALKKFKGYVSVITVSIWSRKLPWKRMPPLPPIQRVKNTGGRMVFPRKVR